MWMQDTPIKKCFVCTFWPTSLSFTMHFCIFDTKTPFFSGSGITLQSPIKTATDPRQPEEVGRFRGWNPNPDDLETTLHKNSWPKVGPD